MSQPRPGSAWATRIRLLRRAAGLVLAGAILTSWLVGPYPPNAIKASLPLLLGIGCYALLGCIAWPRGALIWFVRGLCLLGAAISLIALVAMPLPSGGHWQYATAVPLWPQERLPDTLNGNVVAGALVLLWPFVGCLGLWDQGQGSRVRVDRLLAAVVGVLLCGVLMLTLSRAAQVALALTSLLWLALWRPSLVRWLLPLVVIIALAAFWRTGALDMWDMAARQAFAQTVRVRFEIWSRAWRIIRAYPLTGIGFGNFQPVLLHTAPLTLTRSPAVTHAHNLAMQVALDLGLPGLGAVVVLVFCAFRDAWRVWRQFDRASEVRFGLVAISCLGALAGMSLHGLVDSAVWGNKGAFVPWLVMGLCTVLARWAPCDIRTDHSC